MLSCENCCYFAPTENPEWKGKPHCCFNEWGHRDYEVAPCDEPDYDEESDDYYDC